MEEKYRFDETDREEVFEELERLWGTKYGKIKSSRKFRGSGDGNKVCVIGGYGNWHAIPEEVLNQDRENTDKTVIVFAAREKEVIELYRISASAIFQYKNKLTHKNKVYYFHIRAIRDGKITLKEIEGISLQRFHAFPYYGLSETAGV